LNKGKVQILGVPEQYPGKGQKRQVRTKIFKKNPDGSTNNERQFGGSEYQTKNQTEKTKIEAQIEITKSTRKNTYGLELFNPPRGYAEEKNYPTKPTHEKHVQGFFCLDYQQEGNKRNPC
jgi:hypothetical protein